MALVLSLLVFFLKKPKYYFFILIVFGLLFFAFGNVIVFRFLTVKNFGSDLSSLGRLQAWIATISLLQNNLWTGYGFDSFLSLRDYAYTFYLVSVVHSHNTYLRSLLEMGLVGTVLYFSFLVKAIFYTFKIKRRPDSKDYRMFVDGLQLSFVSLLIVFMFEPYFSLYGCSTLAIWFLISIAYKINSNHKIDLNDVAQNPGLSN